MVASTFGREYRNAFDKLNTTGGIGKTVTAIVAVAKRGGAALSCAVT